MARTQIVTGTKHQTNMTSANSSTTTTTTRSGSDPDPASTLRAAALLTLKSKRRRPNPTVHTLKPPMAARPVPENQVQLDYGNEDSAPPQTADSLQVAQLPKPEENLVPPSSEIEDGQIREEGEISEEEDSSMPSLATPVSGPRSSPFGARSFQQKRPTSPPQFSGAKLDSTSILKSTTATSFGTSGDLSSHTTAQIRDPSYIRKLFSMIDPDHVRPGLARG